MEQPFGRALIDQRAAEGTTLAYVARDQTRLARNRRQDQTPRRRATRKC